MRVAANYQGRIRYPISHGAFHKLCLCPFFDFHSRMTHFSGHRGLALQAASPPTLPTTTTTKSVRTASMRGMEVLVEDDSGAVRIDGACTEHTSINHAWWPL